MLDLAVGEIIRGRIECRGSSESMSCVVVVRERSLMLVKRYQVTLRLVSKSFAYAQSR